MTIDEAKQLVDFIANKNQRGYITGQQFNLLAPVCQFSVINDMLGNKKKYQPHDPTPNYGFGISQAVREQLRPILVKPTAQSVTAGVVSFPADYLYYDVMTNAANGRLITEATEDEIAILNISTIKPPTTIYPKFVLHSNGFNIYPTTGIATVNLAYVRKPATPIWNFTESNDRQVYNPSGSQDFEIGVLAQYEVVMLILQNVGVNLTLADVTQFAMAMEGQGK